MHKKDNTKKRKKEKIWKREKEGREIVFDEYFQPFKIHAKR